MEPWGDVSAGKALENKLQSLISLREKEKCLASLRVSWLFLLPDQSHKAGGRRKEENLLASAKTQLRQSSWSSRGAQSANASLCSTGGQDS